MVVQSPENGVFRWQAGGGGKQRRLMRPQECSMSADKGN